MGGGSSVRVPNSSATRVMVSMASDMVQMSHRPVPLPRTLLPLSTLKAMV